MVVGTAFAGCGILLVAIGNSMLVPLTVDLRNAGIALVEMMRAFVFLVGVLLLVLAGSKLDPFLALQILIGLLVLAVVPLLVGRAGLVRPRFDRARPAPCCGRRCPSPPRWSSARSTSAS